MTHSDDLLAVLEKEPNNFDLYGIVADLLEEEGEGEPAIVFRWCCKNEKCPKRVGFNGWAFFCFMHEIHNFPSHWVQSVDHHSYYRKTIRERLASLIPFINEMI